MGGAVVRTLMLTGLSRVLLLTLVASGSAVAAVTAESGSENGSGAWSSGGMQPMEESELAGVTGEGIAIGLEDVRIQAGSTTRFEAIGVEPNDPVYQRADARWYGFTLSGDDPESSWVGPCGPGIDGLGCPLGGEIGFLAPFDNPYLLRSFDYSGINYTGGNTTQAVLELLAPTEHEPYRYSAWTEFIIGGEEILQGQAMLPDSRLFRVDDDDNRHNSKIRIFSHTDPGDPTIAFQWHNHWQGDFRFSVRQTFASQDEEGVPPIFGNTEGFYARDIEVFMPLGQLFYQSLILDDVNGTGNFRIELTRPNQFAEEAWQDLYSIGDPGEDGYDRLNRPARYDETHGLFRVGNWTPPSTCQQGGDGAVNCLDPMSEDPNDRNSATATDSGLFFVAYDQDSASAEFTAYSRKLDIPREGITNYTANDEFPEETHEQTLNQVNLGDLRIEGMLIQHMELRTRGID